jgi:hypothetical protein
VRNAQAQIGQILAQLEKDTSFFVNSIEVKTLNMPGSNRTQNETWKSVSIDVRRSAETDWKEETFGAPLGQSSG